MSPRTGRPPIENPKADRITVRLTAYQQGVLSDCSKKFGVSKADIICQGLTLMEVAKENSDARQLLDAIVLLEEFRKNGRKDLVEKQTEQVMQNFRWYLDSIGK